MVARGRGGGGGRRGEQTFSRIHIFSRSLDFCASIISRTFFCSTIFTRSKHFLHPHFCKDFHAYISITRSITFPASVFLQEARIFIHKEQKKNLFGEIVYEICDRKLSSSHAANSSDKIVVTGNSQFFIKKG